MNDDSTNGKTLQELDAIVNQTNDAIVINESRALLIATLRPVADRIPAYTHAAAVLRVYGKDDADAAALLMAEIKKDAATVKETLDGTIEKMFGLHRAWTGFRNRFSDPMNAAYKTIKGKVSDWQAEEERKARELQSRLQKEADEKARIAREKAEAEARIQRDREAQAQRDADEAARKATEATNQAERERLQREASKKAQEASKAAAAAERHEDKAASVAAAPVVTVQAQKATGLKERTDWKFEITDEKAIPREYCLPDAVKIGKIVKAMKADTNIPGVRVYSVKV